jgi:hypothetical protein
MRRAELRSLLERPWRLASAAVVLQWLTTLAVGLRADGVELGARELLNVVVLGPLVLLCAFRIAQSLAGPALGAWTLLVWVTLPWLAPLFTLARYDPTLRDEVLPMALGLTADVGYPEGVALLATLALLLQRRRVTTAAGAVVLVGLVAVWLARLPVPDLSRDTFDAAMAGLREYFWSQRLLQWAPLAGVVAMARRSVAVALALAAWLGVYAVIRLGQPGSGFEDGEFFRALLPALPAYVLLLSALPLLVPTLAARLGPLARRPGSP